MKAPFNPFTLRDKVIIVTGASSGIGRQCAISCSKMGAKLILIARSPKRLEETLALMDQPEDHLVIPIDLTNYGKIEFAIKKVFEKYRSIDGAVHCAGISTTHPLRTISIEKIHYAFQTNVYAAIHLTKLITKSGRISKNGSSIVFISSVMGIVGESAKTIYGLTKGALIAGAKSLAIELAPKKIRVNSISPGVVVSPMSKASVYSQEEKALEQIRGYHPLGLGNVNDIANASIFLLSGASNWITGTNLIVDGGYTAR